MKYFSYHLSKFNPDRDILQIRICTAQSPGCRDRLMERCMDFSGCVNKV